MGLNQNSSQEEDILGFIWRKLKLPSNGNKSSFYGGLPEKLHANTKCGIVTLRKVRTQ